jgi:hypothetical protein
MSREVESGEMERKGKERKGKEFWGGKEGFASSEPRGFVEEALS